MENRYIVDNKNYIIPTEEILSYMRCYNTCDYDKPDALIEVYISHYLVYGERLLTPSLEHLRTIKDKDMPENYIEDLIKEFWDRLEIEQANAKFQRFKLLKVKDKVASDFSSELKKRAVKVEKTDSCKLTEDILMNYGYSKKEVLAAMEATIKVVKDLDDPQEIINKAISILNGTDK